jgi:S-adenosyl methyltransferase
MSKGAANASDGNPEVAVSADENTAPWGNAEEDLTAMIDTTVPVSARIWNYWMGGKDYYPVDRAAGDEYAKMYPGVFGLASSCRYFIVRSVQYLAGEAGIRQFLDIGTGLPSHDNTHEIAHRVAPEARVVYVDNDPMVLTHARALLTSSPPSTTDYIEADLNDPGSILKIARQKLDFARPVAIMLMGILGHIGNPAEDDDRHARSVVETLKSELPSGGYLAICESLDTDPAQNAALDVYNQTGAVPYRLRRADQIARFFDGLELVQPGLVPIHEWRPDLSTVPLTPVPTLGGVAKKQ